jgi:hypothetical protein
LKREKVLVDVLFFSLLLKGQTWSAELKFWTRLVAVELALVLDGGSKARVNPYYFYQQTHDFGFLLSAQHAAVLSYSVILGILMLVVLQPAPISQFFLSESTSQKSRYWAHARPHEEYMILS